MADENNKCGHSVCLCTVGDDDEYCSPQCTAAGEEDITEIAGDCGHSGCNQSCLTIRKKTSLQIERGLFSVKKKLLIVADFFFF